MLGGKVNRRRLGEEARQPLGLMPLTYAGGGMAGSRRERAPTIASLPVSVIQNRVTAGIGGTSGLMKRDGLVRTVQQ